MSVKYQSVSQPSTSFGNPRQKTWIVLKSGNTGWYPSLLTTSFIEAQGIVKNYLSTGGEYGNINNIMVAEIVPIDLMITPQV